MAIQPSQFSKRKLNQDGGALVVSLLILLVMTFIGITGMQVTSLEEKMAGNMRDRNLAFQAAESALRTGELALTQATVPLFNCSNGLYRANNIDCDDGTSETASVWNAVNWSSDQVVTLSNLTLADVAANPAYIIEELPPVPEAGASLEAGVPSEANYYRVTARGVGGTENAVVMVQSTYKR